MEKCTRCQGEMELMKEPALEYQPSKLARWAHCVKCDQIRFVLPAPSE